MSQEEAAIGPYNNFTACEGSLTTKYGSSVKANKICSMLQKQTIGRARNLRANYFGSEKDLETFLDSKKVMEFDKNGQLYIKNFLFDRSISANYWGVDYDSAPKNIHTVLQKPIVQYQNTGLEPPEYDDFGKIERVIGEMDHPPMDDGNLAHTLEMQEPYRVGTYGEVVEHPNDGSYWGLGTIHDDGMKRAFTEDPDLPFFTSSAIRSVGTHYIGTPMKDWIFLHSAIVDRPAFGVRKAHVSAQCTGDSHTCLSHLRRASVNLAAAKGIDMNKGCPFCTYKSTKQIAENIRKEGLEDFAKPVNGHGSLISSYLNKRATILTDKKVSDVSNSNNNNVNSGQTSTVNPVEASAAAAQANKSTTSSTTTEDQTLTLEARLMTEMKEKESLQAKLAKKDEEIRSLQSDLKVATTYSSDLQKKVDELDSKWNKKEADDNRKEIARVVKNSKLYANLSEEEKEKKVDLYASLVKSPDQVKEMLGAPEEMVIGLQQNIQQGAPAAVDNRNFQGPQNIGQPAMGMNATSSTHQYNDGTEYGGHNRTASIRDNITESGQPDGLAVLQGLKRSYFQRGSRSEV